MFCGCVCDQTFPIHNEIGGKCLSAIFYFGFALQLEWNVTL